MKHELQDRESSAPVCVDRMEAGCRSSVESAPPAALEAPLRSPPQPPPHHPQRSYCCCCYSPAETTREEERRQAEQRGREMR